MTEPMNPEPMIGEEDVARAIERSTWDSDFDFEESWLSPDYELVRHNRMIEARAAISAHLAALERTGWAVVPPRPTNRATCVGANCWRRYTCHTRDKIYDGRQSAFREVTEGLFWRASDWLAMLWVYFDASGEHDAGGHLKKLTLGGSIAQYETWEIVSEKWEKALKAFDIEMFHMADFEANRGQFEGWEKTPERRKNLLNALLDICCEHLHFHVGFVVNHPEGGRFTDTYKLNVVESIAAVRSRIDSTESSPFALVYARHPEFSLTKLEQVFADIGQNNPKVRTCATLEPMDAPPLQVADIVAYEISRYHRATRRRRYPWQRLRDSSGILVFTDEASRPFSEGQPF